MSSANKYPSGLNLWVESDRPEMADFNEDNRVVDSGAMWKEDYDGSGEVGEAGGIAAFVGREIEAGGIAGYSHRKAGNLHHLTILKGSENGKSMKFTASADYLDGDGFTLNGNAVIAMQQNGLPLPDKYFKAGAAVTCTLAGEALYFAGTSTWKLLWSGNWGSGGGNITVPGLTRYRQYVFVTDAGCATVFMQGSRTLWGSGGLAVVHPGVETNYSVGILLDRVGETLGIIAMHYFRITEAGNFLYQLSVSRIYGVA